MYVHVCNCMYVYIYVLYACMCVYVCMYVRYVYIVCTYMYI